MRTSKVQSVTEEGTMQQDSKSTKLHETREIRSYPRTEHSTPIQFVSENSYRTYHATMRNYSNGGMYIESKRPLPPGKDIRISMSRYTAKQQQGPEIFSGYFGRIVWCAPVEAAQSSLFGAGIEYDYPVYFNDANE